MAKELETLIAIGGQLDPSLLKVINAVNKNIDGLERQIKVANKATVLNGGSIGNVMSKIGTGARAMGTMAKAGFDAVVKGAKVAAVGVGAVAVIATALTAGAYKLSGGASDLVESQNVVEQTFKTSAKAIEAWTLTTAKSAGISQISSTTWAGAMGAMLKSSGIAEENANVMSRSLVQLTGDFSSFYNLASDDAYEKIRAGIAGETEPLRQLGINMSVANMQAYALAEGIKTPWAKMSQAQQTMLRYNYLMQVTADAQGDFGRTLGTSFANQTRVAQLNIQTLGNSIGQKFLPSVMDAVKAFNGGFDTGNWADAAKGMAAGITGVLNTAMSMAPQAVSLASTLLPALIGGIVGIMPQFTSALVTGALDMLSNLAGQAPTLIPALLSMMQILMNGLVQAIVTYAPMLTSAGITLLTQFVGMLVTAIPQVLPALIAAGTQLIAALAGMLPTVLPVLAAGALTLLNAIIGVLAEHGLLFLTAALDCVKQLALGLLQAVPKLIPIALSLIQSLVDWFSANHALIIEAGIQAVLQLALGLINALPQLVAMVPQILMTIINTLATNLPLLFGSGAEIIAQLIAALIQCLPTLMQAIPQITGAIAQALFDNIPMLLDFPKQLFDALVPALGEIDWGSLGLGLLTGIVNGMAGAGNLVVNALNGLLIAPMNKMLEQSHISLRIPNIPNIPTIPGYASGVLSAPGGLALVGENGPELMNVPARSTIYNNSDTTQMLSGLGQMMIQIIINVTGGTGTVGEDVKRAMQAALPDLEDVLDAYGLGRGRVAFG